MARTVDEIKKQILDVIAANGTIAVLVTNPSQVAIFRMIAHATAVCIAVFEQIIDIDKANIEDIISKAPVGSDLWLQKKVLEFQYDSVTPQVVELDTETMAVAYPVVDVTKRIISRAAVITTVGRIASVKVATGEPPAALSAPQLAALQTYLTNGGDGTYNGRGVGIGFAGTQIIAKSYAPDKFFLQAEIKYDGRYANVISANVISAINNYFANIEFNGKVKLITLYDYIQAVPGVMDIFIQNAAIRDVNTIFANKSYLIQAYTELLTEYPTYAGYVIGEDTVGETLADRLTFTATI